MRTIKKLIAGAILVMLAFIVMPFLPLIAAWIAFNECDDVEEE